MSAVGRDRDTETRAAETDADLVARARGGSSEAFTRLVQRHELALYRFLRVHTGNARLAEEVQQDAFVRCWTKLHLFDRALPFRPWLLRLAANIAHSERRARARARTEPLGEIADERDPAALAAAHDESRNLWQLAERALPRTSCSALWLCHVEGLPAATIGDVLGKTEGAIRTLLSRSRAQLATLLRGQRPFLEVR